MIINRILPSVKSCLSRVSFKQRSLSTLDGKPYMKISPDVREALARKHPVIALESTIITHGMPYPENYKTALEVENIVREKSVVPATMAVIEGIIHVGLTDDELLHLSQSKDSIKISRRGLSASIAFKQTGGTTVSATMLISHWCGIPIFVTGGIGGVHRGAESTMDISSDLTELGKTPVTVISAGVKSILDIPKTLEYLETQGVTVVTFGNNDDFPAFFTSKSGCRSPMKVTSSAEAANLIKAQRDIEMDSGCLITVPIPETGAASGEKIENAIQRSLKEAESMSISGAAVTPFILKRVNEITGGESLKSNIVLIKNNAAVGAEIAKELTDLSSNLPKSNRSSRPVVIGATNIDIISKTSSDILYDGPSNPASVSYSLGGVGRNIAEGLARYGDEPAFVTALGNDRHGKMAESEMNEYLDISFINQIPNHCSGIYLAVMDKSGTLKIGTEDLSINDKFGIEFVRNHEELISQSPLVCIDANLPTETLRYICELCKNCDVKLFYEPTGSLKAGRIFHGDSWKSITHLTPNMQEFEVILSAISGKTENLDLNENANFSETTLLSIMNSSMPLIEHVQCLIVTLAKNGVATFTKAKDSSIAARHYPLSSMPHFDFMDWKVKNVSGSGDSFAAAFIHGLLKNKPIDICTKYGLLAAQYSLRAEQAIPPTANCDIFVDVENMEWKCIELN